MHVSTDFFHFFIIYFMIIGERIKNLRNSMRYSQTAFGKEEVDDMTNGKAGKQLQDILTRVKTQVEDL